MIAMRKLTAVAASALVVACGGQSDDEIVTKTGDTTVTSASGEVADDRGVSLVRVVNALPGQRSLTIHAGDETPFSAVDYKSVTPYREVRGNMVRFRVLAGGAAARSGAADSGAARRSDSGATASVTDADALASNNEVMTDGNRYTLFVMPDEEGSGVTMKVVRDEIDNDSTKAQIRFVNAAAPAGELDLTMQGREEPLFDDVNYGSEAGFKSVDPVTGALSVRREDGRSSVATVREIRGLEAGKSYTVVITGRQGRWDVITFEDMARDLRDADSPRATGTR